MTARPCRVMTYNIRLDTAADGDDSWAFRRRAVAALIAQHRPDVLGLQEVLPHQRRDVEVDLPDYAFVGVAREDGDRRGESTPIGFLRDRFVLRESGTFWLSPTPAQPTIGWDAACPRIATWARLQDAVGDRRLLVVNTHLDHVGAVARVESARMIRGWARGRREHGEVVVVMGDFNSAAGEPAHAAMTAPGDVRLRDTLRITETAHAGPLGTFTGFGSVDDPDVGRAIDHVFVGDGVRVLRHVTVAQRVGGRLPSDHSAVLTDITPAGVSRRIVV